MHVMSVMYKMCINWKIKDARVYSFLKGSSIL